MHIGKVYSQTSVSTLNYLNVDGHYNAIYNEIKFVMVVCETARGAALKKTIIKALNLLKMFLPCVYLASKCETGSSFPKSQFD